MNLNNKAVDLTGLAIGIIILGIVVSIGAVILTGVRDARLTDLDQYTTANQSFDGTATLSLSNIWVRELTSVVNTTGGQTVPSSNYTLTINDAFGTATFVNTTALTNYPDGWNVSYSSYNTTRADWALPNQAAVGLLEYGNWFDILVIVGVAGVVLALIFMAFGRGSGAGGGEGGVAY